MLPTNKNNSAILSLEIMACNTVFMFYFHSFGLPNFSRPIFNSLTFAHSPLLFNSKIICFANFAQAYQVVLCSSKCSLRNWFNRIDSDFNDWFDFNIHDGLMNNLQWIEKLRLIFYLIYSPKPKTMYQSLLQKRFVID